MSKVEKTVEGSFQFTYVAIIYLNVGTSTDVSRFAGQYEHVFETTTAGITIQAPQVTHPRRSREEGKRASGSFENGKND